MTTMSKLTRFCGVAIAAMLVSGAAGAAVTSAEDCTAQITAAEEKLLNAKVTNEQLTTIAGDLQTAASLCASGDFVSAGQKIDESISIIDSASQN